MTCTNYSAEPFKSIVTRYNTAAADYVAALMESPEFTRWWGSTALPVPVDLKITNAAGKVWDLRASLNTWLQGEAKRQGFLNKEGRPVLYGINEEGVLSHLTSEAEWFNQESNPFKARVIRQSQDGQQYYRIVTDFNREYKKPDGVRLAEKPKVDKADTGSFFYLRHYDPAVFTEGRKTVSIRPDLYQEGVYNIGESFFRVSLRSRQLMYVKDAKEGKAKLRKAFIQDDAIEHRHIQDFFDGKLPMFVYDIEKINVSPQQGMALPDFLGSMGVAVNKKAPGAKHLTGYTDIDKYIETLVETKSELYNQRAAVRRDAYKVAQIDTRIENINKQIDRLKADAELSTLMVVGRQILNQLQSEQKDIKSFREIDNAMRLAKAWSELDHVLPFDMEDPDEESKQLLKEATEIRSLGQTLFTHYKKQYVQKLLDEVDTHIAPRKDGRRASRELVNDENEIQLYDIDKLGAWTIGKSFSANAMEQLLNQLTNKADYAAEQESYAFEQRLGEAVHDLLGVTAEKSKASDFDFLYTKDHYGNKVLITKYDRAFYKELYTNRYRAFDRSGKRGTKSENYQAALALGATADELKAPLSVQEYYGWEKKYINYELTTEGKVAFEQFMAETREAHVTGFDEAGEKIYDTDTIEAIRKEYDPQVFQDYVTGASKKYNKGARWFTKRVAGAPLSKPFAAMTAKQRAFYDFFVQEYIDGQQDLAIDHRFGELDLDQQLLDFVVSLRGDLKDRVKHLGANLKTFLRGLTAVRYFDNPIVTNTRSTLTGLERKGPEFRTIDQFIPGTGEGKAHPLQILSQFRRWGHLYKHKREIEDKLNAIKDLSITAKNVGHTNDGRLRNTQVGKLFTTSAPTNLAARMAYNVDVALTGKRKDAPQVDSEGKPGQWKASMVQTIDSINNYTRFKNMALSPMSGLGNFVMGGINNFIYAASGQHYNDKELAQAYWILKENIVKGVFGNKVVTPTARKIAEIMRRYALLGDVTEELYHENEILSWFFVLQKNGEFLNQGATAIAQMLRQKVALKDGGEKNLFELYELDETTKRVTLRRDLIAEGSEFQDDARVYRFFEKVKKVNMKVHGDYTNALMAKKEVWGRVLLMFRTWLPMAVKERFGKQYTDELLGDQKGRYLSAWTVLRNLAKSEQPARWQDFAKLLGKLALPILGRKIKFSNNLDEVDRQNLQLFVREMHFIMMLTLSIAAVKAQVDDEEDPETTRLLTWLYNQGERTQSELVFFFSPKDAMQITKDLVPLAGTLTDASRVVSRGINYIWEPEADEYQKGFRKGTSKLGKAVYDVVPLLRQIEKTEAAANQIFSDARYQ